MTVAVKGPDYEILVLSGGTNGIYYDEYHSGIIAPSTVVWKMTNTNNMENYSSEVAGSGIHPGSSGVVSFYVKPFIPSIDLDLSFEILGYTATENSGEITMTQIDSNEPQAVFLSGHILLFAERSGTAGNYTYGSPILSNEDMKRIIANKTFTGAGTETLVNIYWVWPQTLSDLVDARTCQKIEVTKIPFAADSTSYNAVVNNILDYPDYYCKGVSRPANASERLSETNLATDYDKYGDYYDLADNDIGMYVDYILLRLSTDRSDTSGESTP